MINANKTKEVKSHIRQMIDIFIVKNALDENNSIFYDDIDLKVTNKEKSYLLENLIKDDFVIVKEDDSLWFNKTKWDKEVKDISNKYMFILIAPIIVTTILIYVIGKFF